MSLLSQLFFLSSTRVGATAGVGGGLIAPILGFIGMFFLEPYYNGSVNAVTTAIGVSPFNPFVPLSLMVIAAAMFVGPILWAINSSNQSLPVIIMKAISCFVIMAMSVPLFFFALIHWWFYTSA